MTKSSKLVVLATAVAVLPLIASNQAISKPSERNTVAGRQGAWHNAAQGSPSLADCERKVKASPQDASANNDLGWAYRQHGDLAQAEHYLRAAIKLKPDLPQAHSNLSVVLFDRGAFAEATAEARKAVDLDGKNPVYRVVLGNALSSGGNLKAAIQEYRTAVELKSDYENALYNLGRTLAQNGQTSEAKIILSQALRYDATDSRVLELLDHLAGDSVGGGTPQASTPPAAGAPSAKPAL